MLTSLINRLVRSKADPKTIYAIVGISYATAYEGFALLTVDDAGIFRCFSEDRVVLIVSEAEEEAFKQALHYGQKQSPA